MNMQYWEYLSELLKRVLKKFDLDNAKKRRIIKEFDLEIMRSGLTPDILLLFYYLIYISCGEIDDVKKRISKRALLQPGYSINPNCLSEDQINTIVFTVIGFVKKLGYDSQFNQHLIDWSTKKVEECKPLLPFIYQEEGKK